MKKNGERRRKRGKRKLPAKGNRENKVKMII